MNHTDSNAEDNDEEDGGIEDALELELITLLGDICYDLNYSKASHRIKQLKEMHGNLFKNANVILNLHKLLNNVSYDTTCYKFIFSVFDLDMDILELESATINTTFRNMPKKKHKQKFIDPDVDGRIVKRQHKRNESNDRDGFHQS